MTDFKGLKKETLDSIILSEDKNNIAFRTKSGWLYFYQGWVTSITGSYNLDDKYGQGIEGLSFKGARFKDYVIEIKAKNDWLVIAHKGLEFQGAILEKVLQENPGYRQLVKDF